MIFNTYPAQRLWWHQLDSENLITSICVILSIFFHGKFNQNTVTNFILVSNHCSSQSKRTLQEWYFSISEIHDGHQNVLKYSALSTIYHIHDIWSWSEKVAAFLLQHISIKKNFLDAILTLCTLNYSLDEKWLPPLHWQNCMHGIQLCIHLHK